MSKRLIVRTLLTAAAALLFWGCSTANPAAPQQNPTTGAHPAAWLTTHYSAYLTNPSSCTPCHGSTTDQTQAGGTSGVTCFGCHHPEGPNHPAGWQDHLQHGRLGAQAAADATPFSMKGMASCAVCHGADYNTPVGKGTPSCYACHMKAPHPDAPWGATNPPPALTSSRHDQTDQSNAPACFQCHAAGSTHNLINPPVPAPSGTVPGCFNNTMCHGTSF